MIERRGEAETRITNLEAELGRMRELLSHVVVD